MEAGKQSLKNKPREQNLENIKDDSYQKNKMQNHLNPTYIFETKLKHLPFVGGAGRILLATLGLLRSDREQARLKPLESVTVGSVL